MTPGGSPPARLARGAIRLYQLTLSGLIGRQCRHLPTCSEYCDEAVARHGFWAGGWMGLARLSRCRPWGSSGYDPPPAVPPERAHWARPWRFGEWRPAAVAARQLRAAKAAERASNLQRASSGSDSKASR